MRLDNFLTKALSISRSEATKLIKDKKVVPHEEEYNLFYFYCFL